MTEITTVMVGIAQLDLGEAGGSVLVIKYI